jgi:hypothetical protein
MFDDWINMKKLEWAEPPFEPEIDLNFIGLNAKIKIKDFENTEDKMRKSIKNLKDDV